MNHYGHPPLGHDGIAAALGAEILSGARAPGSRMPSAPELFARFGISRVLMREVMKTLTAKGLIASKSRVGTHVLDPSHWHWFDPDVLRWRVSLGLDPQLLGHLAQMRRAVEPAGAALAALHRSEDDLARLQVAVALMSGARGERRSFVDADLEFHRAVSAASGNPLFQAFCGVVEVALGASFAMSVPDREESAATVQRHKDIADAIEAGDAERAAQAMQDVIDEGIARAARQAKEEKGQ